MADSLLEGRRALITGAASGIGRATAELLHARGASVLAADVNDLTAPKFGDDRYRSIVLDVTDPGAPHAAMAAVREQMGGLDILVNAAGICPVVPLEDHPIEAFDQVMDVNLRAMFRLSVAAIPWLKESESGRVINIGSVTSEFAGAGLAAYTVSKHGVAGLTRSLATELGPFGITANFVQPGAILTAITRELHDGDDDFRNYWAQKAALGRWGQPDDVAKVVAFLASDDAAFVSGHGMYVDGGAMQQA